MFTRAQAHVLFLADYGATQRFAPQPQREQWQDWYRGWLRQRPDYWTTYFKGRDYRDRKRRQDVERLAEREQRRQDRAARWAAEQQARHQQSQQQKLDDWNAWQRQKQEAAMTPVGGSRHYSGGGLGEVGLWGCPSCGEDNTGPLTDGCVHCGAGKPGSRPAVPAAPPPPPAPPEPVDSLGQGDVADDWAAIHPEATVTDAYRAGYLDGIATARRAAVTVAPAAAVEPTFSPDPDRRIARTIVAALTLFRDQVLPDARDEIASGEWASVEEVTRVLTEISQQLETADV